MDERQVRLIKRSGSIDMIDGGRFAHTHIHTHSQALDDALKFEGLPSESMVHALGPSRSHHKGPPVPWHRVS